MPAPRKHAPKNAAVAVHDLAAKGVSTTGIAKHFKVSRALVARWFEEDEHLEEIYEQGRDSYRQELEERIIAMTVAGKNPAGFIYLLKSKFKMFDVPYVPKVDVNVDARTQSVMYVTSHGTDEEWAARCAAQQRGVILSADSPRPVTVPELQAPLEATEDTPTSFTPSQREYAPAWNAKA